MACATLKRPLEWSDPSMSPPRNEEMMSISHSSPSQSSSSSHWPRPAKRRCSIHVASNASVPPLKEASPFGEVESKLTSDEIAAHIRDEMIRLYHRKRLHLPSSPAGSSSCGIASVVSNTIGSNGNTTSDAQCSLNAINIVDQSLLHHQSHTQDGSSLSSSSSFSSTSDVNSSHASSSSSSLLGFLSPSRRDLPLFTFRQVGLICERLMKEREKVMRQEYDQVLNNKLAEQYDTFVKFTYDQIQKRFDANGNIPSYCS